MDRSASVTISPTPMRRRRTPLTLIRSGIADITSRRRLIRFLVGADLKRTHADTAFGQLWWMLDPLLQMVVYFVFVTIIFERKTPDYPLFLFAAILPWKWFSTTINDTATSVTVRQSLIRQVQFPKIVLPTSAVVAGTVSFALGLSALAVIYLFYLHRLSAWVLLIPVVAAVQFLFTLALGVLVAAVNAFFRDVQNVIRHVIRLWFYLSPALYTLDDLQVPQPLATLLRLNPFAVLLESYRDITWGTTAPNFLGLGVLALVSLGFLMVSIYVFKRAEPAFARIL